MRVRNMICFSNQITSMVGFTSFSEEFIEIYWNRFETYLINEIPNTFFGGHVKIKLKCLGQLICFLVHSRYSQR